MNVQNLKNLTLQQSQEWDQTVRSFSDYDVYYLSGYVKTFQLHGDGEPLLFHYEGNGLRGMNVVMKRDVSRDPHFTGKLPEETYFDFATPYGYGGWLLEGKGDRTPLFAAYEKWCRDNAIVSEFVRFHPVLGNTAFHGGAYEIVRLGGTVTMDLSSPENIWANLTSKNRNMIRKARKNGLRIYNGRFPKAFDVFREIYNATMDKDQAKEYYYFDPAFYESVLNDLPHNAQVFWAQMTDGTVAAASILLSANGRMNYHLSGSCRKLQNLAPTNLLLYEAALWGCANGCKTLHLGGGVGSGEDSLYTFKKAFYRGDPCRFHIGRKVFLPEIYENLTALRMDLPENSGFFPRYRA
ncbi:GNAT family N-acetyltransferase [uncultured Oscillibacter sp.]|uniref:GNAT family N-acetyltransferase n=1 Tax=uncultured Oscillibacter sp. TaxID=876091 RepID=UPI0026054BAE|nr:GNAT family N-acetyltransferase [uncultured Oscillibacter sp.]